MFSCVRVGLFLLAIYSFVLYLSSPTSTQTHVVESGPFFCHFNQAVSERMLLAIYDPALVDLSNDFFFQERPGANGCEPESELCPLEPPFFPHVRSAFLLHGHSLWTKHICPSSLIWSFWAISRCAACLASQHPSSSWYP